MSKITQFKIYPQFAGFASRTLICMWTLKLTNNQFEVENELLTGRFLINQYHKEGMKHGKVSNKRW